MAETTIITTVIQSDIEDFDIRREFCGFQDKRLNDLRQFTSCIIDLQTLGTKDPFEKVNWIITHYDQNVRAFVIKRIQAWVKTTQIAVNMHAEDMTFHQQIFSDSSSSSNDGKMHQFGQLFKSPPSPPTNSVPIMFNKISKTPSQHHCGSIPNAALVPQTDIHNRYSHRQRRSSSSSTSAICRPALFGKPSDFFQSTKIENIENNYSQLFTPISKLPVNGNTHLQNDIKQKSNTEEDGVDLEEEARWSNLLSDTSDFESDCHPLMADIILVSQLRDCLMNARIASLDDTQYIRSLIGKPLSLISTEQQKMLQNKSVWFHRLSLNSKIILSNGVHKSRQQSEKIAFRRMIELMTNTQGVEPKIISNGRCKVIVRKAMPPKTLDETTVVDSTMNATIDG